MKVWGAYTKVEFTSKIIIFFVYFSKMRENFFFNLHAFDFIKKIKILLYLTISLILLFYKI
jgi:hypothetical protein